MIFVNVFLVLIVANCLAMLSLMAINRYVEKVDGDPFIDWSIFHEHRVGAALLLIPITIAIAICGWEEK